MTILDHITRKTLSYLQLYWMLVRLILPIALITEALSRMGVIKAIAPAFGPVMALYDLPPELGLAWLTGLLIGIWGAIPLIFALVPVSELTVADVTILSSLLLFAHALPIEQGILRQTGARLMATVLIRVGGGMIYAMILHQLSSATGWMQAPVSAVWTPMAGTEGWTSFLIGLAETMGWMLIVLLALCWAIEILRLTGVMDLLNRLVDPVLRLAGISGEARQFAVIGALLGISYGGGMMIREAQSGLIPPRQIFAACVFMGFSHAIIEDTAIVMAIGADGLAVGLGRMIFAIAATALVVRVLNRVPDRLFYQWFFVPGGRVTDGPSGQPQGDVA
ncbi:nucleoside recognition domain-containing protein [Paracoccus zhejiangensis]|uniref:Nucleoside recognition protein n=1 Tax=Paracoccus zhejiangensis TaxID=1077935 RepID=A0A2H5EWD8_9RHOB|nr:nucleoside recognition domain-containing protein [Paracoccus zhejiangensis]AUH63607.1 nucleoside recognition protein [Paracoccus zhejiangensis]